MGTILELLVTYTIHTTTLVVLQLLKADLNLRDSWGRVIIMQIAEAVVDVDIIQVGQIGSNGVTVGKQV